MVKHDAVSIKAKIDKAQTCLTNLIAMRADGELSKEEYQTMRKPIDAEIQQLQERLNQAPNDEQPKSGLELDGIISTLNTLIDFSGMKISEEVINQFIYRVTPTSDTTFDWYVNLNGTADVRATFTAEGRKNRAVVKLEEIEQISSLHRKENEDNGMFLKNPLVFTFLHRRRLTTRGIRQPYIYFCTLTVSREDVRAFMAARPEYTKANRFKDIVVKVYI